MKKLFLLLFSVLATTGQMRADVILPISTTPLTIGNWDKDLYCSKEWCNILEEGDILYGTVTISDDYQIQLQHNYTAISDFEYSAGKISYTLTESDVTNLKKDGMRIRGKNYTLTSLYLKKSKSVIKTSIEATGTTGNWSSSIDFPENSLKTAVENDYVMVSVTPSDNDAQGKVGMSSNGTDTYGFNSYVNAFYGIVTADMAGEESKNGYVQGKNITVNSAALYHPVNSFKIGSIGMATFSAAQKVKVPEGLTAYKATVSGNNVTLTQFTGNIIPANQGAIIKGPQGSVVEFAATSEGSSDISDLIAVTTATDVDDLAEDGFELYVLSACEKEEKLALSNLLSEISDWGGNVTVSSTEPYTAEWTSSSTSSSMGKWLGANWSSYDKLRLVFTNNTVTDNVHFGISYYGHDGEDTGADLATGELTVDIPLNENESYKSTIGNFSFNSNANSGKLTFESAALIDNNGGTVAEFRKTEKGTIAANKAYLKIDSNGNPVTSKLNIVFAEDENKQEEEQQGETNSIRNIANTNVNNNVVYNMNGQRVGSDYKGLVIVNGKKIIKK